MSRFAVIGDPIAQSASPGLFQWLARHLHLDLAYEARRVPVADFPGVVDELRAGRWSGVSITLPHKLAALAVADVRDPIAVEVGAANCLARAPNGQLTAHNTDLEGITRALEHHGVGLAGARVLVIGAGGAARAAAAAARRVGAGGLVIANRTFVRAQALAEAFGGWAVPLETDTLRPILREIDIILQASAAGLDAAEESALPPGCVLHPGLTVMDMVYRPLWTPTLRQAQAAGARTLDGLWMLVFQGLAQLRLWTQVEAPAGTAEALHAHLAEGR
jgi:shikimate dehydrogenase